MSDTKEYFQRIIDYEDRDNTYHPDQMDKSTDIDFIKMAYRLMYTELDFQRKNMAANYLSLINKKQ